MTNERLDELNELNDIKEQIVDLKEYINTLSAINYDYFELSGRYKSDRNADFIFSFNNREKHTLQPLTDITPLVCDGLQEVIISFLKRKARKAGKRI